ncbi:MAG TPA: winged helix DNA-binding domain-containing protein [Acidimicrobiales bacterium]|nr:winged helix DNA-binding domain-containing protein [Acidimicrobiales bacterium]
MKARRSITAAERRTRLGVRHRLAGSAHATDPADVARSLVALHATDPASVFLGTAARMHDPTVGAVEKALYDDRSLVRILGMRRTMFVVPIALVPVVHAACTRAIAATQRRRYAAFIEEGGIADDGLAWLDRVGEATVAALERRGEALGTELSADVPELRAQVHYGEGKSWGGTTSMTTWVLTLLAADERIVRGRPRGSWTSSQYRWAPLAAWLPGGERGLDTPMAQVELARQWLAAFGPGTLDDLRWWTGWTKTATRAAVAAVGAVEVDLDGATGFVLPDDLEPVSATEPWAALLPALDSTAMGWNDRGFYGADDKGLYDRSGNIAATIWCDGRVVGCWAQRPDGEIARGLLVDVGREAAAAIEAEADQTTAWLGSTRITPRSRARSPIERELLG